MDKPRIFLGSSGKQAKLLQALTRGLEDVAHVDPWTTSFNPGTTTLERLLELTHEVYFAAFVFAQDDWTTNNPLGSPAPESGQASPRDNVVFEAGLFGGTLGIAEPSSSTRAARSFQPISPASRAYGTAKRPPKTR
jgi:predicted nucleotide-binding protein